MLLPANIVHQTNLFMFRKNKVSLGFSETLKRENVVADELR